MVEEEILRRGDAEVNNDGLEIGILLGAGSRGWICRFKGICQGKISEGSCLNGSIKGIVQPFWIYHWIST